MIDRSETRDTPLTPLVAVGRHDVRNSRRGNHLGQRSCATAYKGRTYDRKRSDQSLLNNLARRVPSTYGVSRARRLNLLNDLRRVRPRIVPANEIALPIVATGTIRLTPFRVESTPPSLVRCVYFMADTEPGALPKRNSVASLTCDAG